MSGVSVGGVWWVGESERDRRVMGVGGGGVRGVI